MNILVIGGTYFLGKSFVNMACENNKITVLNRGNADVQFMHPENVSGIVCDRHSIDKNTFKDLKFDVVVDFCAYKKGDIRAVVSALNGDISQYIFISTCDVYERGTGKTTDETGDFETRDFGGQAGEYILGKVSLEHELKEVAKDFGFSANSIRPAFIYGPGNYADRESMFINWIEKAGQIIYPEDADGTFQMVHVDDVSSAVRSILLNEKCINKDFNIVGNEVLTYEKFAEALRTATGIDFEKVCISVEEVNERGIPLPFPLTKAESERYTTKNGSLIDIKYRPLEEGIKTCISY